MRIRSGYSFRKAYGFLPDIIKRISTPYAPLTDVGSTYGHNRWRKECEKAGKRPVYGIELAVTSSPNAKKPTTSHVTLIAGKTLEPINRALETATAQFRYEPLLTYQDLNSLPDDVTVILGRRIEQDLLRPDRQYWLAHGPSTPARMLRMAQERGWGRVTSSDNVYPAPEDRHPYAILMGRDATLQTWPQHVMSDEEWLSATPGGDREALAARDAIAALSSAEILKPELFHPEGVGTVEDWCLHGAKDLGVNLDDPVYSARLERELQVIKGKGYEDYFLIIADMIRYAKTKMFVGPARGSSCGSLVCYLMGITSIDPLKHDLLFERFLDPGRTDMPDIDIDFSDQRRDLVFTYLSDKYGRHRVARLGTIAFMRARSIAKEILPLMGVPTFKFEPIISSLEIDIDVDNRDMVTNALRNTQAGIELLNLQPGLAIIERIEGHPRHHSTHASGVLVTDRKVTEYVAIDARSGTAEMDKKDAEDLGHLKIDALGLKQLSIFEDCLELLGHKFGWLVERPLDDPAAFEILNQGKFSGVFQFNGHAVQQVTKAMVVEEFEDLVSITSLARPGPMASGGTDRWLNVRMGRSPTAYPHPVFEPILSKTRGVILYQEQVMEVGREIADMDWARVTQLRKAVQYKKGAKEMETYRQEFVDGALRRGVSQTVADAFWNDLLTYGSYVFNRSHAVAYSMISYWCCYLKAHHPLQYAAAMLNHEGNPERQRLMLRELAAEGIQYKPVDAKTSTMKWAIADGHLVGPITNVKGLGIKTAREYVLARDNGTDLPKRAVTLLADPKTPLDSLTPVTEAIKRNHPDLRAINIISEPISIGNIGGVKADNVLIVGRLTSARSRPDPRWGGTKLSGTLEDDTGDIRIFISSKKFPQLGKPLLESGRVGETLWAMKGAVPDGGGILFVNLLRFLGTMQ